MSSAADPGKREGTFWTYHPDGELESEGNYVDGLLDGTFVRYVSSAPGATPLRGCCVPPGARELRATYRGGELQRERFFDAEGRILLSDGTPEPARPHALPEDADFDEFEGRWVVRREARNAVGLRQSFERDGRLYEERDIVLGRSVALRSFARDGSLRSEHHFDDAGRLHGAFRQRHDEPGPYANASVREERGSFEHGQSTGPVRYFDASGHELCSRERGEALSDERLLELGVAGWLSEPAEALFRRATELAAVRRIREALFATACASGRAGRLETLEALLASTTLPLTPERARARAAELEGNAELALRDAFEALVTGADAADVLRLLATLVPASSPAGRDLVEAAILLSPRPKAFVTRALLRLEHGDPTGALEDVTRQGAEYEPVVQHLRDVGRLVFAKPAFSPDREPLAPPTAELTEVVAEQPLAAVRWAVALYATRLGAVRDEIKRRLDGAEPAWLPPELSHVLGEGPLELRRFTTTITDEGDTEGSEEKSDVAIDETLTFAHTSVKALMTGARAEFDALSWLCWSAGLDEIALPTSLVPRADFKVAVNDAMHRCFRAHDQVRTGGLVSNARGVADCSWEGLSVGSLSRPLADIAARQYLERRALFFWLLFPENLSPFQSDLREV